MRLARRDARSRWLSRRECRCGCGIPFHPSVGLSCQNLVVPGFFTPQRFTKINIAGDSTILIFLPTFQWPRNQVRWSPSVWRRHQTTGTRLRQDFSASPDGREPRGSYYPVVAFNPSSLACGALRTSRRHRKLRFGFALYFYFSPP